MTTPVTERDVATVIALLESATGKPAPSMALQVWTIGTRGLTREALLGAADRFISENEYPVFPTPGAIRRRAVELTHGLSEPPESAWERVLQAVSRYGYPSPDQAHEAVGERAWGAIIGIGGWSRVCDSPVDQRGTLFAQFRDAWNRVSERQRQERLLPPDIRPSIETERTGSTSGPAAIGEIIAGRISRTG